MSLFQGAEAESPRRAAPHRPDRALGRTPAWWGMVLFVATESMTFACMFGSYFYVQFSQGGRWPPPGVEDPRLIKPLIMTGLIVASVVPMAFADIAARRGRTTRLTLGLVLTFLMGAAFLGLHGSSYLDLFPKLSWSDNAYASLFYGITAYDGVHVAVGLLMLLFTLVAALFGKFGARRHERVRLVAFYWYFVAALWVVLLAVVYLSPRLGGGR